MVAPPWINFEQAFVASWRWCIEGNLYNFVHDFRRKTVTRQVEN